jgi:hypothetical protein
MAQGSQQYSAAQILEAARRAQAEGRIEHAVQFYRHLTGHMGHTAEAALAEQALMRIELPSVPAPTMNPAAVNGHYGHGQHSAPTGPPAYVSHTGPPAVVVSRSQAVTRAPAPQSVPAALPDHESAAQRRFLLPKSRRRYRTGRIIARTITFLGFMMMGSGTGIVAVAGLTIAGVAIPSIPAVLASQSPVLAGAIGAILLFFGAMLVLGGQLGRAIFDHASAARELAALSRARARSEARVAEAVAGTED